MRVVVKEVDTTSIANVALELEPYEVLESEERLGKLCELIPMEGEVVRCGPGWVQIIDGQPAALLDLDEVVWMAIR
jgi:hypothetical protein